MQRLPPRFSQSINFIVVEQLQYNAIIRRSCGKEILISKLNQLFSAIRVFAIF